MTQSALSSILGVNGYGMPHPLPIWHVRPAWKFSHASLSSSSSSSSSSQLAGGLNIVEMYYLWFQKCFKMEEKTVNKRQSQR